MLKNLLFSVLIILSLENINAYANVSLEKMNLPLYIVPEGKLFLDSDFIYNKINRDVLNPTGQRTEEQSVSSMSLSNDLRYGLGSGFDFGINMTYWLKDELERTPVNTTTEVTSVNSSGLEELSIMASYRIPLEFIQGLHTNINLDIAPSFSTAESATTTEDANHYKGHHEVDLAISAGMISQKFSWRATFALKWDGKQQEEPSTSSTVNKKTESAIDLNLEIEAITSLSEELYVGAILAYDRVSSREYFDPTSDSSVTNENGSYSVIELKVKFDFFLNQDLALNFGLNYQMIEDQNFITISSGNVNNTYSDQSGISSHFGIQYLF